MELYAREHEAWARKNIEKEQRIKHLEMEKHQANRDFNVVNKNLAYLRKVQNSHIKTEPKKENFYIPSSKMRQYEKVGSGMVGFGLAYASTKLLDLLL